MHPNVVQRPSGLYVPVKGAVPSVMDWAASVLITVLV